MKRIILVLAMVAIVAATAALGGAPAVAGKAGDITGVLTGQGEPGPGCEGPLNATEKGGNPKVKENAKAHGCFQEGPPPRPF